jgi:Ice-binding-like
MNSGVPQTYESLFSDSLAVSRRPLLRAGGKMFRVGLLLLGLLSTMLFASSALGATATVGLGSAASFSVLGGSTITNTGPTKMFGDLGLSPGSSVTGAPQVLGQTHVDDAVAIAAKNSLTTGYNNAASRPSNGSAGTDLAGQTFLPGVRTASSSLLLSSGSVTLDAQGDPNAVFIFQIGSTLITESNTTVLLVNGAQACNVFWQVGSSATLGTGTRFVGTIMSLASITANTGATIHGRLLAREGAVTMDTNTITTSNCPSSAGGTGGGTETTTGAVVPPTGSKTTPKKTTPKRVHHHAPKRAHKRHSPARPVRPHKRAQFTG